MHREGETVISIDLGSNSFHMLVAECGDGALLQRELLRETVRLEGGLDPDGCIDPVTRKRALEHLRKFAGVLKRYDGARVRVVATNTLRVARNAREFCAFAGRTLGHPVEVLPGDEEARLIYLGVARELNGAVPVRRLVIDVGGGSTEVIIGEGDEVLHCASLPAGCVPLSAVPFADAEARAAAVLRGTAGECSAAGWTQAVGSSGTVCAVRDVLAAEGWCPDGISAPALSRLRETVLAAPAPDALRLRGLPADRRPILSGGLAVLCAAFDVFGLEHMTVSESSLRDGVALELMQRAGFAARSVAPTSRRR